MESNEKAEKIKEILEDKKALDVSILKIEGKSVIADYFVIATGTSSTHVKALADETEFKMEKLGIKSKGHEGRISNLWILIDYGDVIVHIFDKEARELYNLEELWNKK